MDDRDRYRSFHSGLVYKSRGILFLGEIHPRNIVAMSVASASQGPMLVGHMFNVLLMGVVLVQVYIYMITYEKRDKLWLKAFVLFLLLMNLLNTVTVNFYTQIFVQAESFDSNSSTCTTHLLSTSWIQNIWPKSRRSLLSLGP